MKTLNETAIINAFENLNGGKFKKALKKNKMKSLRCTLVPSDDDIARVGAGVMMGAMRVVMYFNDGKMVLEVADNYSKTITDSVVLDNHENLSKDDLGKLTRIVESFKALIDVYVKC